MSLSSVSLAILFFLQHMDLFTLLVTAMAENKAENYDVIVQNYTVEEGKSAVFTCDSASSPPFYYYKYMAKNIYPPIDIKKLQMERPWPVYAIYLSNSPTNLWTIPTSLGRSDYPLNISNITVEFHNVLICCQGYLSGTELASSAMSCYRVNVQFSPKTIIPISYNFGQWISPLQLLYSQYVVISCPLEGNPSASYQWYKSFNNDVEVIQPYNNLNIRFLNNDRTLYFDEFKEEHNGTYICNAKNLLGNETYSNLPTTEVNKCMAFDPPESSVTINASHNLVAYIGDNLNITCIVASLPDKDSVIIRWFKNMSEILPSYHIDYSVSDFDKIHCRKIITLYIRNLTFEDSGNYICYSSISDYISMDNMLLAVRKPVKAVKQPDNKSLIIGISIPVSIIIILLGISVTLGIFYYLHMRQLKLQKALEEYCERSLPKKGDYQYEFFFAMTEDDEDKLEVDELYVELKQTFSIYYRLDQYLPGRTKVEMVIEGIKNSRFIIILLSKAYLQQKSEIARLELMYTMNRIKKEFTKCAFIIPLEDNLFIPYKLRHIIKLSKEGASIKLKELALSSEANFFPSEDSESVDALELEALNDNAKLIA